MNVILTGFMGTGKSSVGRFLACRLGYSYRDIDAMIVEQEGKSINDIFSEKGETYFRSVESSVLRIVLQDSSQVVSTGGGAVIRLENREAMKRFGVVINLVASADSILNRLRDDRERPLLRDSKSLERIEGMLAEREQYYCDADIRIDTNGKKVEDVAREILKFLKGGA
ncbi:MAG TPA: shikimate kinase [Geobacteraceae bacterium]|nr:shikimate kinase [Geobacteraceae bacterium]